MNLRIKYHNPDLVRLQGNPVGNWIDVRAAEDVDLEPGDTAFVSLGFSLELPEGYEGIVAPRSSSFKNFGFMMTNSFGVVDTSYCGNNDIWKMPIIAMRDVHIKVNDRIGQFRIVKSMDPVTFTEVDDLGHDDRGGFGSTGTK